MKRVAILCNSVSLAVPTINALVAKGLLVGVGVPQKNKALLALEQHSRLGEVPVKGFEKATLGPDLAQWARGLDAEVVLVLTFPYQVPQEALVVPKHGFINFHFGQLPGYAGPDPVFWQIFHQEPVGGIMAHQMTEDIDRGDVLLRRDMPLATGETYGLHCTKLGGAAVELAESLLQQLATGTVTPTPQVQEGFVWRTKPTDTDLKIDWQTQTAQQIECLVNATNPRYGGATAILDGFPLRILEVAPADLANPIAGEPGTIVYADVVYGIVVKCLDGNYLKVNVVHTPEGYFSGAKLFCLGVTAGKRFV